jgi:hypothetical protein
MHPLNQFSAKPAELNMTVTENSKHQAPLMCFLDGGMKTFQQLHHSFCTENPLMFLRMSYGDLKFQGLRVQGEA